MEKKRKSKGRASSGGTMASVEERVPHIDHLRTEIFTPEDFLTANDKVSILSLNFLKNIYDLTKSLEDSPSLDNPLSLETERLRTPLDKRTRKTRKRGKISKTEAPLPTLITDNFDEDQVWEELELQNGYMYDNLVSSVSKLLAYKERSVGGEGDDSDVVTDSGGEGEEDMMNNSKDHHQQGGNIQEEDDSDFFETDEKNRRQSANLSQNNYKKSVVDDRFFSLAQMTEHIEQLEADMERGKGDGGEEDDEQSDDDDIDLFEDVPSESDNEEKEEPTKYFYKDFFDPPMMNDPDAVSRSNKDIPEQHEDDGDQQNLRKKSVTFEDDDDEQEQENAEDDEEEETANLRFDGEDEEADDNIALEEKEELFGRDLKKQIKETLSSFEKSQQRIEENIKEIENEAMEPKSWHLLGESTAENRPENALLEEHLIYDHLSRPAPEITVETTLKLEDVIKLRIKDGAWDDVQRKVRPVEDPREYKKRLVLDAEKSKASLAEIYEKEYIEKKKSEEEGQSDEKEPEEHIQIRKDMRSLFQKLDALSNFHFTPKAPTAEVKIVSNMPSISVEETAATSISDANMLAPQEIQDHAQGAIKGKDERTSTDKNRERRKKKKRQHLKRLAQEEKARMKGLGLRNIKLAEGIVKSQQKLSDSSNVDNYSTSYQNKKELKSSKAFFAKLQEGAASHIDKIAKRKAVSNNNSLNSKPAKKFKL